MKTVLSLLIFSLLSSASSFASSDSAWAELEKQSAKACIAATGFLKTKIGPATQFSDENPYDVRLVSGVYPQKHMKGAKGKMLCLYSRASKKAEVQDWAQ